MAKKSATGVNKSAEIRAYLAEHRTATPKEVATALQKRGIAVSEQLVSNVKFTSRRKEAKKIVRERSVARLSRKSPAAVNRTVRLTADDLIETKRLVDQLGGTEQARRALELLEQLR